MEILVSHFFSVHELELPGFSWRIQAGGQWGHQSLLPLLLFHFLQTCFCKGGMGFCCVLITLLNLQYHRNHKYVPNLVHCSLPNSKQGDTVHIYPIINQRLMTYSIPYFHASLLRIQLNFSTMLLLQHQFCVAKWLQGPSANTESESESEVAQLCPTLCNPAAVAYQAPPSMGFSRQEYWSGLPFPSPGDLPNPGIKRGSSALQTDTLLSEPPGKPSANIRPSYKFMSSVAGKYKLLVQLPSCSCEKNFPIPPRAFPLSSLG